MSPAANSDLNFSVEARDPWSEARAATLRTAHGQIDTPVFMPVATRAALRGVDSALVDSIGFKVLLANTYHLLLRPGPKLFEQFKGIHNFMNWPHSVLTDSGGFQIFSLSRQLKMTEEGARFRSYLDGSPIVLTPEVSIAMQRSIGSDIMMVLDHCISSTSDIRQARDAVELSTRWARRSFSARGESTQALFGIVQGACFPELRRESALQLMEIPFDGFALGGLAVGESKSEREDIVAFTAPLLPQYLPRYLMGVGTPIDLLEAVKSGIDMFDCILPTSLAHQGVCFTSNGRVDLRRGAFKASEEPLDRDCACSTCTRFSRSYLHHLIASQEFVADQLLGIHNLTFYHRLMHEIRESIIAGSFKDYYTARRDGLMARDSEHPVTPPKRNRVSTGTIGDYSIVVHSSGYGSIQHRSSGEVMHSVVDPVVEARSLYVRQSRIAERALEFGDDIVIWDVGLGAATNAMVGILDLEALENRVRTIRIYSFERDLDPLRLALTSPTLFKHLRHAAPHELLKNGLWHNKQHNIVWQLLEGQFEQQVESAVAPDIIWYDPFSYKVNPELWSVAAFELLKRVCAGQRTELFTYTASTAVRAAMLAAGWYVGAGQGSGPKSETTIAYSPAAAATLRREQLLGAAWLERWKRSDAQLPMGEKNLSSCDLVLKHPQFAAV